MTIQEAIDRVDLLKPNRQPGIFKVKWLSELDGLIWKEIILKHEREGQQPPAPPWPGPWDDAPGRYPDVPVIRPAEETDTAEDPNVFRGYDEDTDPGTVLLVPFPYDEIYTWWLMSKVDIQNQEIDKYNNDRALFNNAYDTFSDYWTREHMPVSRVRELRI